MYKLQGSSRRAIHRIPVLQKLSDNSNNNHNVYIYIYTPGQMKGNLRHNSHTHTVTWQVAGQHSWPSETRPAIPRLFQVATLLEDEEHAFLLC